MVREGLLPRQVGSHTTTYRGSDTSKQDKKPDSVQLGRSLRLLYRWETIGIVEEAGCAQSEHAAHGSVVTEMELCT